MSVRYALLINLLLLSARSNCAATPAVDLINAQGPIGLNGLSESIALCGDVRLGLEAKELVPTPGHGVVAATTRLGFTDGVNASSKRDFADCEVQLEFLIASGSNSGVKLQKRYEIQLYDSHGVVTPTARQCGGIYPHWVFRADGGGLKYIDSGVPPLVNAAEPAGQWQTLRIIFRAPRFNSDGEKTSNAQFVLVSLNDKVIHRGVEVESPTGNASNPLPEVAKAPLLLQLDHGAVAFRKVRVTPLSL